MSCQFTHQPADEDEPWACHRDAHESADVCVFHMDADERAAAGVTPTDVRDRLLSAVESGDECEKRLLGADLPELELDYRVVDSDDRHPVDLRGADVDALNLRHTTVRLPVHLQGARVGSLTLDNAVLEKALRLSDGRVGAVDAFEAELEGDADFDGVAFETEASFVEAAFEEDVTFEGASFDPVANFRGAVVAGGAELLGNNGSFADATFGDEAHFDHATFEGVTFADAEFLDEAGFEEAAFTGDVVFEDVRFGGEADFDEARFVGDATFDGAAFETRAVFRGVDVDGGADVLEEDFSFDDVAFADEANFRQASFAFVDFEGVEVAGRAMFEEAGFDQDAVFRDVHFRDEADFDETRFDGDADFSGARFDGPAVFRGAEFTGEANHLEDNVSFEGVTFADDADFDNCSFTAANFVGAAFGGVVDFAGSTFSDRVDFAAEAVDGDTYVDLTDASLAAGRISQPADNWIRYDLTRATLGDVRLTGEVGEARLLDYFRIADTRFDGFDFTAHREHFERSNWRLHEYLPDPDDDQREYALDLAPATLETTYLRAADAAKSQGARDAAVEFSIQKAYWRRQKNVDFLRNERAPVGTRLRKGGEIIGNFAWHQVCGYGYRLWRVLATSILVIFLWGVMYAFLSDAESGGDATGTTMEGLTSVGQLATADGLLILGRHVYFSLITFTTVGYGDVNPLGPTARTLAATEGALGVLLASLVVFVLGRRVAL